MKERKTRKLLRSLNNFFAFFLVVAFVVTCCMLLFLNTMAAEMGIELTSGGIETAAKITFLNVILVSAIIALCDLVRRKLLVDRPAAKIVSAGRRMMKGDFSVRIEKLKTLDSNDGFTEIAECFNKMAQELSATETLRNDFISNVSHEIKTPLALMQNYAKLLEDSELSEEKRIEYAKAIGIASRRLSSLVTNILKLNKLENQKIAPKFEKYDLSQQICECMLQFEDLWEKKKIDIQTDIDDGIFVCSDSEMMSIVWNNLISNAIKFTDEGGTVSVSVKASDNHATIKISDTGCGMSREVGKHIFDKFYQADSSRATEGNGLGLALVKKVVDITNNTISVESRQGEGTTFTVRMRKNNG